MKALAQGRLTRAARWSRRAGAFAAALFLTAGLSHRYGLLETPAFLWVLAIVCLIAVAALAFAAFAFSRFWTHGDRGGFDMAVGTMLGLIVLAPFAVAGWWALSYPMLSDVSTDIDNPPRLAAAAALRKPDMNPISDPDAARAKLQSEAYPTVTGRRYDLPFDRTLDAVEAVIQREGWAVIAPAPVDSSGGETTIEALARTAVFAFPVDVGVRLTDEGPSTYVDMRSNARYGRHDLGDNAARITEFLAALDTEVAGRAGAVPAP